MAKGKRKVPGINASSTADISFILLIFFLVVTSMNSQEGLHVTLPRKNKDENKDDMPVIKQNNILMVLINSKNQIRVTAGEFEHDDIGMKYELTKDPMTGEYVVEPEHLRIIAKDFIVNKDMSPKLPNLKSVSYSFKEFDDAGVLLKEHWLPSGKQYDIADNHVISLTTDRETSYSLYFRVLNELYAAYNELRDEMAEAEYGKKFAELETGQKGLINEYYKYRVFEAEPVSGKDY